MSMLGVKAIVGETTVYTYQSARPITVAPTANAIMPDGTVTPLAAPTPLHAVVTIAAGGISVAFWMWLSSLADMGTFPLGIAAGNFGAGDAAPHAVTTVGMILTILMLATSAILAVIGSQRQRQQAY